MNLIVPIKKKLPHVISALIIFCLIQCAHAQNNIWVQKNAIGYNQPTGNLITGRHNGICLTIGNKAYVGLGLNFFTLSYQKDFWEYDPATNTWSRKADFPFIRQGAFTFSIGNKGYVGAGTGQPGVTDNNDFWEYDPTNDKWTKKADYGGGLTTSAFGFSIGNKGYAGTGSVTKAFWEYDPSNDTWTQKADFAGGIRRDAVAFSINNKGYAGTGFGNFLTYYNDLWEYDPSINIWTKKADLPGVERDRAVGFSIGNKGYIGTGVRLESNILAFKKDFWEFDPGTNIWTRKTDFGGTGRMDALGFSINGNGYISSGSDENGIDQNDLWEYTPSPPINTSPPVITLVSPSSACAGSTIIITGSNFMGTTSVSIGNVPVTSYTVNTSTTITAIVGNNSAGDIVITTLNGSGVFKGFTFINSNTSLSFNPDTVFLVNATTTILNPTIAGAVNSFQWSPSNLLTNPFSLSPQTSVLTNNAVFTLSVITPEGCDISAKVTVMVGKELYMPNAFTPNNDGVNDYYGIPAGVQIALDYLTIYDKWGNRVFYTTNAAKYWDGKYRNIKCNAGGFVYILKGMYKDKEVFFKGSFILIR